MTYQQCKMCDEPIYAWRPPHKCKPKQWCWLDDGDNGHYETDDGGTAVYAHDARFAAEKFCSEYPERGDWADCVTVVVKSPGDEWVKVVVSAQWEWTADYEDPKPFTPKLRRPACHDRAAGANDVSMGLCQPCFDTAMSFMPTEETA